jgi:hypothetical protein
VEPQDDLKNLNIEGGKCLNASVQQNVTFRYQGLPFGTDNAGLAGRLTASPFLGLVGWGALALGGGLLFGGGL